MSNLVILQKPQRGEPCNRCGLCCTLELCAVAMEKHRPGHRPWPAEEWVGPCPSLTFDSDGVSSCGLLEEVRAAVQIGAGCFAPDVN